MDGETFLIDPDAVVVLGVRSVMSLFGLMMAVVGYWIMERRWDNDGAAIMRRQSTLTQDVKKTIKVTSSPNDVGPDLDENPQKVGQNFNDYVAMPDPPSQTSMVRKQADFTSSSIAAAEMILCGQIFHESGCRDLVRVGTYDSTDLRYHPPTAAAQEEGEVISATAAQYYSGEPIAEFQAKLKESYPVPVILLVGSSLWSLSFFLDPNFGGFRFYCNVWNALSFLLAACVGPIFAYPLRQAIISNDRWRKQISTWAVGAAVFIVALLSIGDWMVRNKQLWYLPVFGAILLLMSYPILQRSRRMGISWDQQGKPKSSSELFVQNLGTPLLILGVSLFWIGTNVVPMADLNLTYLPIWTTISRSWCAFFAGMLLIVPAQLALDLAFDQGSQPIVVNETMSIIKLDGNTFISLLGNVKWVPHSLCATILETPILLALGWSLMSMTCFLPFGVTELTVQQFCCMAICIAIAPTYGILLLPSLWRGDLASFTKWTYTFYALMILWATSIGIKGGIALFLSAAGVLLILVGHRWDLFERKRGMPWLVSNTGDGAIMEVSFKTSRQVYGVGQPLNAAGWVMLCLAMSIPM